MANAVRHFENAVFHFGLVRRVLNSHFDVLKCLNKNSVKVIDIGCGSGRVLLQELLPVLPKDFTELVGVDKNESMIEHCRIINNESRVSFHQLDITTKHLPEQFIEKFDLVTSFYCLHYARDYNQMLQNLRSMLKPHGEILYVHPHKLNPLYETFRELGKIDCWRPYFKDFSNYVSPFSGEDPEAELEDVYKRNDLKLLRHKFETYHVETAPKNFIESLKSLDTIKDTIPVDLQEKYTREFHECFSNVMDYDYISEERLNKITKMIFHQVTIYAQKH